MSRLVVKTFAELEKVNPFRRPDWRWERILTICDRVPTPGRCTKRDDEYVQKARNFLLRYRNASTDMDRQMLAVEYPGLYIGYKYHEMAADHPDTSMFIEARLLARQTPEQIAAEDGTHGEAIQWYERLFFNISDRLDNNDWVLKHILLPCVGRGYTAAHAGPISTGPWDNQPCALPYSDVTLKFFAYYGGAHAVDVLLAGFRRGLPVPSAEGFDKWLDRTWTSTIKRRTTMAGFTFEVNKFNVTELFMINSRLIEVANAAENEDMAQSAAEQHILAFLNATPWARSWIDSHAQGQDLLQSYDEGEVELRDDEVLLASAGEKAGPLAGLDIQELPPPQRKQEVIPVIKPQE